MSSVSQRSDATPLPLDDSLSANRISAPQPQILTTALPPTEVDFIEALPRAAKLSGRPMWRIAVDIGAAMLDARQLAPAEYFVHGGWAGSKAERAAVVGKVANRRVNRSLTATGPLNRTRLMDDKFAAAMLLSAHGFPVAQIKAVFATQRRFEGFLQLTTPEELSRWLLDPVNLPAFAKPVVGSHSMGTIPLRPAGDGRLDIGAQAASPADLAQEVARLYPGGWLIQELLQQPPEIEALIGPGIGTVRVVTLWEEEGPQLLYGVWRHPPPGTWVDAVLGRQPNVGCALDAEGRVARAWLGDVFTGRPLTHSLISPGLPLVGFRLSQWREMVQICREAHQLFPGHALIGWDIAMTQRGPVISELNAVPMHMSYQRAYQCGFLHPEHRRRLDVARTLMLERVRQFGDA